MALLSYSVSWNWTVFCGIEDNLTAWNPDTKDVGQCFQTLYLNIPVLSLIAVFSAYYCGKQSDWIVRPKFELNVIRLRYFVTLLLSASPIVWTYIRVNSLSAPLSPIQYLLYAVQTFTWLTHFMFLLALRHRLGPNLRGPPVIQILWFVNFILECITLRSLYLNNDFSNIKILLTDIPFMHSVTMIVLNTVYGVTLVPNEKSSHSRTHYQPLHAQTTESSPLLGSYSRFREDVDQNYLGVAMEGWGRISRLLFSWVNPLMVRGVTGDITTVDDLFDLPVSLTSAYLSLTLERALAQVQLLRALHRCFWKEFYGIGILKFAADVFGFCGPLLLNKLVTFIETKQEAMQDGYLYAGGLCAVTLIGAFCNAHFNFLMAKVGLKIRGSLITTIYKKTLSLGSIALSGFNMGEIVNFMSTDTDRIVNSCPSFHAFWSIPFQIGVTLYLLYLQVGVAFLAGVAFSVVLIPINKCLANQIGRLSVKLMKYKDERVQVTAEVLKGIRVIKLHVWEDHFIEKITGIRVKELKYLKGRKYLDAMCVFFWATTPVIISVLTFTTYTLLGYQLNAATVFTTIALLNMLIAPLNAFPWVLNGLTEAWVSLKRIERLLKVEDLDLGQYYSPLPSMDSADGAIVVKDAEFYWGSADSFHLSDINFVALKGQFIGIYGAVGSGKSSILLSILAELQKTEGLVAIPSIKHGFGYVSQTPWLQRGTLRDNILFGKPFDQIKYKTVLEACALTKDLETLPGGDQVGVGEGGATLSGGQKARVALARAVYQERNVYLLDDVLSAVDPTVANHILQHCINGLLQNKTRILCTHQTQFLLSADTVVHMDGGKIINQGPPSNVLVDYEECLTSTHLESGEQIGQQQAVVEKKASSKLTGPLMMDQSDQSILDEEGCERGHLAWRVYTTYCSAVGYGLVPIILLSVILMQITRNTTDLWMAYWVTHIPTNTSQNYFLETYFYYDWPSASMDSKTKFYLTIYGYIAGINTMFTLLRAFLFAYGGIRAAVTLHQNLLNIIIRAKVVFFDVSPIGRILNRFSSDIYTIDDSLPFIVNILLAQFFGVLGSLGMTVYGLPWLCLVLIPLIPVYHWLQNHYRLTSRELKRLSSLTLSPLYNHFNETLQGIVTIRAFRAISRFRHDNESKLECSQKAQLASQAASQWLSLRLQLIGVAMVTGVGGIAVLQHQFDVADPGLVGLAISYVLSVTGLLSGVVSAFTESEREMISVERVEQYLREPETENLRELIAPPYAWPSQGVVSFENVMLKYREHLPPSLNGVSFSTRPAERIGIVGRTGAGKSSMLAALFRLVELHSGRICIDTVNIAHIGLTQLRSRMAIIPQEAFLFTGTLRENLDPLDQYRDSEIWTALQRCSLINVVRNAGGLDSKVNLSAGQAQLLCLARAVLHNAKILCIDEATANVDEETDKQIQETIRNSFKQSTVLTIAHRVRTIMDSDRVIVMGEGKVLEFDTPEALLSDKESHFYRLVHQDFE